MATDSALGAPTWLVDLVATIDVGHGPTDFDPWAPRVADEAGQVVGLRGADGTAYLLKAYPRDAGDSARTEVLALDLLGRVGGLPVPRVLHHGERAAGTSRPYVVMTRLPGVRWADRRGELDAREGVALHREVGRLLRRFHVVEHERFGDLLPGGRSWATGWARVSARCDEWLAVRPHRRPGWGRHADSRSRRRTPGRAGVVPACAVLCHHDLVDRNVLVSPTGPPTVTGVLDLERASWDDPLSDLARTRLQARSYDEVGADALVKAYGLRSEDEQVRLAVHEVLHAVAQRIRLATDGPPGWRRSAAALDAFIRSHT